MAPKTNSFFEKLFPNTDQTRVLDPDFLPDPDFIQPVECFVEGEVLHEYEIENVVRVRILDCNGQVTYCVSEPKLDNEILAKASMRALLYCKNERIKPLEPVGDSIVKYYARKILSGLGPLYPVYKDPHIEEIAFNGGRTNVTVYHRMVSEGWIDTNIILDEAKAARIAKALARKAGKPLSPAHPMIEGVLPEGHRIAISLGKEVSRKGTSFVIRMAVKNPISLPQLVSSGTLSPLMAAYLWLLAESQGFIMILGGMASGKSLIGDDRVLVRLRNKIRLLSFNELWQELTSDIAAQVKRLEDMEIIEDPGIEILTLSGSGIRWVKPKYLIRHKHNGKVYKIRTKTGRTVTVTPDHSLLVWNVGDDNDRFSINLKPVRPSDILGKKVYVPYLRSLSLPESKGGYNEKISQPEYGYFLGFMIAEASMTNVNFYQQVGSQLETVLGYINKLGINYSVKVHKKKPHIRIISIKAPDNKLVRNIIGVKTAKTKKIPDVFWGMSEEWRFAFLAGIIDGDGYVCTRDYVIEIATASEELAYHLLYAFASVGIHAYVRTKEIKKYPGRVYYRVFIPIGINKKPLKKIMKWLSPEKRARIEEAMEKSANHHSETDVVPAEIAYAIGTLLKRKEHERDSKLSLELRSYRYKGENPSFHRIEELLGDRLYEFIPQGVGFDEVEEITEEEYEGHVYDIEVPETQNFEANGIFVHNTTLMQAILNMLPDNQRVVTIEDTPELNLVIKNWDPLVSRPVYVRGGEAKEISLLELSKFALRRRAEHLVIGEVRGEEARILAQAAATGHGSMCLPYNERLLVDLYREGIVPVRIGDLGNMLLKQSLKEKPPLRVVSIDPISLRPRLLRIRAFLQTLTRKWITIHTETGRVVKVTPNHIMLLWVSGKLRTIPASQVGIGAKLPVYEKEKSTLSFEEVTRVSKNELALPEPAFDIEVETTHTFTIENGLVLHNCTFHADSVRSALFRLMSDPISLKPGFTGLIWAFVLMKVVAPGVRRVVRIVETVPRGPNKFSLLRVFTWDPKNDSFTPSTPPELIRKSYRLRSLAESTGVEHDELEEELAQRAEMISSLAKKNLDSIAVREYVRGFYKLKKEGRRSVEANQFLHS